LSQRETAPVDSKSTRVACVICRLHVDIYFKFAASVSMHIQ